MYQDGYYVQHTYNILVFLAITLFSSMLTCELQVTLKEFIELKLFLLTKLEFREFWNSPLD